MKIAKKIIVSVLAAAMIVTGCPSHYVKADTAKKQVTLSVQSQTAKPGATVDVTVDVKDNPGILGATVSLKYDEGLTLTDATAGDAFSSLVLTKPGKIQSPCKFVWDGQEITADDIKDGTILKLSFKVSDTAKSGESYKISVSCDAGDMVDADLNAVDVKTEDGEIGISAFTPGDLNEDNKINSTDVIMMRRQIAGGYEQTINEKACDVNEDGRINSADVILVRRYIAGGYGVNLGTTTEKHTHTMKAVEAKEATCTEKGNQAYYHCTSCGKYYSDEKGLNNIKLEDTVIPAKGHVSVVDAAVAATTENTGLTEGSHCGECGAVLVKQEVVPKLENSENSITYHLYEDDAYLQKQEIENTNPNTYSSETGLTLKNISCEGYIFEGWYDGEGSNAKQVKQIAAGEKGNVDLYAHWTAREYTITFDSPLAKVDSIKYKVNEGATLTNPEWFGYTFMGWTDEKDNLVDKIPLGKTGNITLHANWTSKRNQTRPVKQLGEPIIYENDKDGQYLFAYEIGQMENVPLYTIKDFGNTSGLTISETITSSGTINESTSNSIVNSLAHSTTETTSWTLSKDWNDSLTLVKTHTDESGKVVEDSSSKVSENSVVTVKGKEKTTNKNDSTVDKTGISASIGTSIGTEALGTEAKIDASLTANQDNTTEKSKSKTWNNSSSKQKSNSSSESSTNSTALSSKVSDTYGYNKSHSEGGSETTASSSSNTSSSSQEYATALTYSTQKTETTSKTYSNAEAPEGYYRMVCAGTIHVFAVVGYDIASSSYYVYTYGVQDDDTYDFIDYSKQTHSFDDYENGILPFEVPFEVNQYIDNALLRSKGLVYDSETGTVVDYTGEGTNVYIPDYISTDNGDGTTSVVKIVGIEKDAFAGNDKLKSIKLSKHITEIPDQAFEGCSSLTSVKAEGLQTIGDKAFSGCSSLDDFTVTTNIKKLGKNAFTGAGKVTVNAKNSDIANAAITSGATKLIVNLADMEDTLANKTYDITKSTDYFELNGGNKAYKGLKISSDAKETTLNGFVFEDNKSAPIVCSSEKLNLARISAKTNGFAMILSADKTDISLYGTIKLESTSSNVVLSKDVSLTRLNANIVGKLVLTGDYMIYGKVEGDSLLNFTSGKLVTINEDSYNKLKYGSMDWVLESEVPDNATIVGEKWTYDYTTKITSSNSSVAGYTLYDSSWVWGPYGGWSGWSDGNISGSDSRKVETQSVPNGYATQYNYIRYLSADGRTSGPCSGVWGGKSCTNYQERGWGAQLACVGNQYSKQIGGYFNLYGSAPCWYGESTRQVVSSYKTQYRYADRSKVYTYYLKKVESKESTTKVEASDSISNVKRWVQYVVAK
ncbi:hypothetical protein DXB73_11705 [Clostridium sp. OM05-6BH]|uniref:leucine-rich repeat protein n=1 Tax=unclassified Clostridium TaxID=2614128 RepID=UPI000E485903|nr:MULTISPECIES: leucine-rich repeat protein [unclassified Clostridium]RHV15703.1 hypothetical protein DXB78_06740 [Clostridium sp. OM05-9BH]RHV17222.1 hypothetical protein DXB73_11705 [Clostridium sp. OM05-6BH]